MCMNFIRLRELPAGILSGRNNELHSCYMEFGRRAKTNFSYTIQKLATNPLIFGGLTLARLFFINIYPRMLLYSSFDRKKSILLIFEAFNGTE